MIRRPPRSTLNVYRRQRQMCIRDRGTRSPSSCQAGRCLATSPPEPRLAPATSPLPYHMPATVTRYGVNLFSLNSLGDDWLGHRVTTANFRGPPIVLVSTIVDGADPDIEAALAFAAIWNAPLLAFDRSVVVGSWALSTPVSYTHLTLPTIHVECRSRWSPYH